MRFEDLPQAVYGHEREDRAARWLLQRGAFVVPTRDLVAAGRGPRMFGGGRGERGLVLPDFDCCRGGSRWWTEVKGKAVPWFPLKDGRFVHGIDQPHFEDYCEVRRISGSEVYVFLIEQCTGRVLWLKLPEAGDTVGSATKLNGKPMVNFFADQWHHWGSDPQHVDEHCGFGCRAKPYAGKVHTGGRVVELEAVRHTLDPLAVCPLLRKREGRAPNWGAWNA